ncbi:MAG: GDP-mannose 4,6-dehydratase [Dehalococcoidales bacterium]|nr:GDP-mannose 4,6-dehydratase [Dehalococcoidales bacterium]
MKNKFWQDRRVFISGCTGLLGSWLTKSLVEKGAEVTGLIRDTVPKSNLNSTGFHDRINIVRGELQDYFALERALNEYEIDTVFHVGAQTIVGIANRNPLSTFESNIRGTWNMLEACRRVSTVSRVIVASSDKAYGAHEHLPYDETFPLQGCHPYDVSKTCVDLISRAYYETYKLPVCVTRCGNFYGGGDLNFNRIVPGTIRSVVRNERPIIRGDGASIRDYIFILDATQAYMLLAEKMDDRSIHGEAFNFSTEIQKTTLQMTQEILRLMDREDLEPEILNVASGEIKHQYLSAKKAREVLGWKSKYSLEKGLKETIKWYQRFFEEQKS